GHASFDFWADEHLLEAADAASLAGSPETVVFAWACESQWFLWPFGPSLGEALLLQPVGGASASFGPTGITEAGAQAELLAEVYPRFFNQGLTLGEAVRRAKAAALARHPGRLGPVVHGFNLLGDPSLKLAR
ncbi:MAG TPA: C25 family cysteine peptidase, partial [Vicinamibacteria bacterium]